MPAASLTVSKGVISGGGFQSTYGQLLGGKLFNVGMPPSYNMAAVGGFGPPTGLVAGQAPAKAIASYKLVGTSPPRIDIPGKVTGTYTYVQNVRVAGMMHGRVVRPRGQGAWGAGAPILSVDPSSISHIPDVQVVQKGNFLGVVAPEEWNAIQAAAQLKVTWQDDPILPGSGNQFTAMRAATTRDAVQTSSGDPVAGLAAAAKTLAASYSYPYNGHLPIGPMCCVADVTPGQTTIFSSTQDIENLANTVSSVLGTTPNQVRVLYYEGSGSYGSNTQEDVAESAAIMSQAIGKPVRVQFMRWDEHGWDYYGPEHTADLTAGIDANGNIVSYNYNGWQIPYYTQLTPDELLGKPTPDPSQGFTGFGYIDPSNAGGQYTIANRQVTSKAVPALGGGYFKVTFLRGPERTAGAVRVGADDRRARPRRQHGPGRVPPAEHRDERRSGGRIARRRRLGRRARRGRQGRRVEAEGGRTRASDGERCHRSGRRARRLRQLAGRAGRRRDRQQEDRQDRCDAPVRVTDERAHDQPRPRSEPDVREPDPGSLSAACSSRSLQQVEGDEPASLPDRTRL